MLLPWVPTVQIGERVPGNPRFVDQDGRAFAWRDNDGGARALAFIYTRCAETTECPAVSLKFEEMQAHLPPGARLIEVTIDPAHDTPPVLHLYAKNYGADPTRWEMLTGDPAAVLTFAKRFNIIVSPGRVPGQLVHGEAIAVFDRNDRLVSLTEGNEWQPDQVLAELRDASGERSNPFARLALAFENFGVACGAALGLGDAWARPIAYIVSLGMLALVAGTAFTLLRGLRR